MAHPTDAATAPDGGSGSRRLWDPGRPARPPVSLHRGTMGSQTGNERTGVTEMSSWDEFCDQRRGALERFVNGDAGPYKQLWSHADDVTIFGGWGGYEQGWDASAGVWTGRPAVSGRGTSTSATSRPA